MARPTTSASANCIAGAVAGSLAADALRPDARGRPGCSRPARLPVGTSRPGAAADGTSAAAARQRLRSTPAERPGRRSRALVDRVSKEARIRTVVEGLERTCRVRTTRHWASDVDVFAAEPARYRAAAAAARGRLQLICPERRSHAPRDPSGAYRRSPGRAHGYFPVPPSPRRCPRRDQAAGAASVSVSDPRRSGIRSFRSRDTIATRRSGPAPRDDSRRRETAPLRVHPSFPPPRPHSRGAFVPARPRHQILHIRKSGTAAFTVR